MVQVCVLLLVIQGLAVGVSSFSQDISPPPSTNDCSASRPQVLQNGRSPNTDYTSESHAAGREASVVGDTLVAKTWPWVALVGMKESGGISWYCTGMLINEQWVLSHAICFQREGSFVVRLGEYDYDDDLDGAVHQDFDVADIAIHPNLTRMEGYNDLALVRLSSRVHTQRFISPVCLPWGTESRVKLTGNKAMLLTYNYKFGDPIRKTFQKEIEVTVFPSAQCDSSYSTLTTYAITFPRGIGQETLCAGDPNGGQDACRGDSGGPLVTQDASGRYVAAGIVSQGYGCGDKDYPGLYINLRYPPYLAWIKKVAFGSP